MAKRKQKLAPVDIKHVEMRDGFWKERLDVCEKITIADVFDKFERDRGGALNNFKRVRDGKTGYHAGYPWYDGLIGESIRGASDFLARHYDKELDERLDGYIELISQAQNASGDDYLNTYTTLICPEHRWGQDGGNLLYQHDLYNTGCLVEAGVHHYRATGKTSLLTVAVKLANHVVAIMGPAPKLNIIPAHSLPEEAYLKLYALFEEEPELAKQVDAPVDHKAYLDLVKFWLDMRGVHEGRASYPRYMGEYAIDHRPLVEQAEAVGHSVRAALLYAGMAEYVNITGDEDYAAAARRLWENIVNSKMHISGGIGAVHSEEKFGVEYNLPNDAYLETCASAALAFFARNMFLADGKGEYMDVMERALYNGVLPGVGLGGDTYFYRNPLKSAGDEARWSWHDCPCCPPMYLKVMGEMPSYIYATADDGVYINLYASSAADIVLNGKNLELEQETNFPWDGFVRISVGSCPTGEWALHLRVPPYAERYTIMVNDEAVEAVEADGYAVVKREWAGGDVVELDLAMQPVTVAAHPYVVDDRGKVALQYGPLLYCLEEVDNDMENVVVPEDFVLEVRSSQAFPGMMDICFEDTLYRRVRAVPYYAWANREIGKMMVWLDMENYYILPADNWGTDLYRQYGG